MVHKCQDIHGRQVLQQNKYLYFHYTEWWMKMQMSPYGWGCQADEWRCLLPAFYLSCLAGAGRELGLPQCLAVACCLYSTGIWGGWQHWILPWLSVLELPIRAYQGWDLACVLRSASVPCFPCWINPCSTDEMFSITTEHACAIEK